MEDLIKYSQILHGIRIKNIREIMLICIEYSSQHCWKASIINTKVISKRVQKDNGSFRNSAVVHEGDKKAALITHYLCEKGSIKYSA